MERVISLVNLIASLSIEQLALVIVGFALVVVIVSLQIVGKLVVSRLKDGQ